VEDFVLWVTGPLKRMLVNHLAIALFIIMAFLFLGAITGIALWIRRTEANGTPTTQLVETNSDASYNKDGTVQIASVRY
jgi:hypothetical protein